MLAQLAPDIQQFLKEAIIIHFLGETKKASTTLHPLSYYMTSGDVRLAEEERAIRRACDGWILLIRTHANYLFCDLSGFHPKLQEGVGIFWKIGDSNARLLFKNYDGYLTPENEQYECAVDMHMEPRYQTVKKALKDRRLTFA